jgi:hypothetical protein
MNIWAHIILWDNADAAKDHIVKTNDREKLTIAFVPNVETACVVARELENEGTELIELCGGFGLSAGARVADAVKGRAAVGVVSFGIESITQAAAYKAKFETA